MVSLFSRDIICQVSLDAFKIFSLSLAFRSLSMMCLGLVCLGFILPEVL